MIFKWKSVFLDVFDSLYSLEFSFSWSFIFGHKSSKFSVTFHIIVLTRARWSTLFFYSLSNKLPGNCFENSNDDFGARTTADMRKLPPETYNQFVTLQWYLSHWYELDHTCLTGDTFVDSVTVKLGRKWFLKSSKSNKYTFTEWYTGLLTWQYKITCQYNLSKTVLQ